MQSLRTRRPSESQRQKAARPQQQKLQKSPSNAGAALNQKRTQSARKSRVDDKIKKRLSTRYADISAPTLASDIPAVPALPVGAYGGVSSRISGMGRYDAYGNGAVDEEVVRDEKDIMRDVREADLRELERERFDPDACEIYPFI